MKKITSIVLLFCAVLTCAQEKEKQLAFITAGNLWKNSYAEVGFAYNTHEGGKFPISSGYIASVEMRPGDNFIYAPKLGVWAGSGIGFGLNALYYTNGKEGSFCLRPEIGIEGAVFKVFYGYNIPITNSNMNGVNGSNLNVTIFWRVFGDKFNW